MAPKKNATSSATTGGKTAAPQSSASSAHPDAATRPVAVIITDSFTEELKPLTNVRPRALMPIGNVPLIEYALELLVVNGIKEVKIVTYFGADKIQEHLATTVTYTGKTWLNSNEIKVEVVKGSSGTQSLGRALVDVLHLHQLPEHFILLPVDIITTARNLSNIFATHVRRHRANPTMVLTAAVLEAATPLMDAHRISVRRALETTEKKLSSPLTAMSNTSSIEFPAFQLMMAEASAATLATAKTTTDQEHCTIAYEPQNGYIITGYQSWSQNERAVQMELTQLQPLEQTKVMNAAVSLTLNAKSDTVVRSDLINPGILVISQGFVSEVLQEQAMISDSNDFLRYFVDNPGFCQILAAVDFLSDEQKGHFTPLDDIMSNNAVGASVRPTFTGGNNARISPVPELFPTPVTTSAPLFRSSSALSDPTTVPSFRVFARGGAVPTQPCVVFPVRTVDSYISTNIAVCERRVFPFTRESNFAEKNPTYAVWHHMPNVYVHANQPDRLSARMALGPNAIVGNSCHLGRSASVAGSVLGDRVTIGEGAVVLHSVVMADTVIADGVVVHNSIIGSNVQILAKEMRIESCAVGDNVVVSKDMQSKAWPQGSRVTIAANGVSDASIVGANGSGALYTAHLRGKTSVDAPLQLANLFVRDPPIKKADESDDDSPLSPLEALYEIIYREMDAAVVSSSSLDTFAFTWKQSMLSYGLNMEDLLECITRAIVTYVAAREAQADDPKAAQKAVCAVLKRFCRPVYGSLIKRKGPDRTQHMFAILRGLAVALYTSTAVQERAKFILFYLYAKADEELFEERQWCMVNLKSIIAFDDMARNNVEEVAGVHDEAIVSCGWEWLHDYVDELRADDDEEDGAAAA